MSIARQYGLDTDYKTFMKKVNSSTDKEISAVVDRPDAKDAEIARLTALVASLTLEVAELRTRVRTVRIDDQVRTQDRTQSLTRAEKEAERQRKRRAAAKATKT